jgi:hypothetical protein
MENEALAVADAVGKARAHIDAGDLPKALLTLRPVFATTVLHPDSPDLDVVEAARLFAGVLTSLGESYSALPYSTYAHRAARVLGEPSTPLALLADLIHAFVLRATAQLTESVVLYRDVTKRIATRCGENARPTLAGRADLAITLHAAGVCEEARKSLYTAYVAHREAFGPADPQGIQMLSRLGSLTLDCGDFEQAHQHFDEAKTLCAKHLPVGDTLTRKVTSAARAGVDPTHLCGEPAATQHGLDVRDLFVRALELDAHDLAPSVPDVPEPPEECDPFVSAFEAFTRGTTVEITSHLEHKTSHWMSGVIAQIAGNITFKGGESYPFTIDPPEGPRDGMPDHVHIRIFAPGAAPEEAA